MDVKYIPADWEKMRSGLNSLIGKGMIDELKDISSNFEEAESDTSKYDSDGVISLKEASKLNIYRDFKKVSKVEESTINKYKKYLPKELIETWRSYGYGTFMDGYIKVINPDDYITLVSDVYLRKAGTIPIFATSMGDIILLEKDENEESYIVMINFRKGKTEILASKYSLFIRFLEEEAFKQKALDWLPYPEAIKHYNEPKYDECFGYTPLLGLGGAEEIKSLKKVKLKEHILIITELMGPVQ